MKRICSLSHPTDQGDTFGQTGRKVFQLFKQAAQTGSPEVRTSRQRLVSPMSPKKRVLQHKGPGGPIRLRRKEIDLSPLIRWKNQEILSL
jgi:hypothetical protein